MFEVLRVTFNLTFKGDKVTGNSREMHKHQLHSLYITILSTAGLSRQTSFGLLDSLTRIVSSSQYVIAGTNVSHLIRTALEWISSPVKCYIDGRSSCIFLAHHIKRPHISTHTVTAAQQLQGFNEPCRLVAGQSPWTAWVRSRHSM